MPAIVTTTSRATSRAPRRPTRGSRCSSTTRTTRLLRPGEVQGDRARPDRAGLAGRLPGRRRLRPRRARRGEGEEASGASASTPTSCYLGPHILTSALKRVDTAVMDLTRLASKAASSKTAARLRLQPQERRRRRRQDQPEGARRRSSPRRNAVGKLIAVGQDQGQAADQDQGFELGSRFQGAGARPPRFQSSGRRIAPHGRRAPVLELRGITKRFPGVLANDHVDFDLRRGEVHALLGENGAGKSTLMNVLYGLYRPDEGEILVNGEPVSIHSPKDAIERGIGMVHQHFMLIPVMTVAENIVLGIEPTRGGDLPRLRRRAKRGSRSSPRRSASRSTRTRGSRTSPSASSSASRS